MKGWLHIRTTIGEDA